MRKISEKEMANAKGGGKFWDTIWQCEPLSGSVLCKCRKVYHRFWGKDYGGWNMGMSCGYNGTQA
jgi:hypothetical protein